MTRKHFVLWLEGHNCELSPFQSINSECHALKIVNKENGRDAFMELPVDDRPMRDATICGICLKLMIPVPDGIVCTAKAFRY